MEKTGERRELELSLGRKGYLLGEQLGQGAFSKVYCIQRQENGEEFACKISGEHSMLRREAELMGQICHPLFPYMVEEFQEQEQAFLVMELVRGRNLGRMAGEEERLSAWRTAEIGVELARGLLYLHDRPEPILFRDIKPGHIILGEDGRVRLLDLGCGWISGQQPKSRAGTPGFAAPEQLEPGRGQTPACDVFGLGRTLLEILNPREPGAELLGEFLEKCTRENPGERPVDTRAVIRGLMPFCLPGQGKGKRIEGWEDGVIWEKNIRKTHWKNS